MTAWAAAAVLLGVGLAAWWGAAPWWLIAVLAVAGGAGALIRLPGAGVLLVVAALALAPAVTTAGALPPLVAADVLILGRNTAATALDARVLAAAGVQLVLAPHAQRLVFVAREVAVDGSLMATGGDRDSAPAGLSGAPTIRADGVTLQVRLPG